MPSSIVEHEDIAFVSGQVSGKEISDALRIGIGTVSNYLAAFERTGLPYLLPPELNEIELERRLFPSFAPATPPSFVLLDFVAIHEQLRLKGVTHQLLWEEYGEQHGAQA